jgi:integrase
LTAFADSLQGRGLDLDATPAARAEEDWIARFAKDLKRYAPATESLYLTAAAGWYEYLAAEQLAEVNLPRMRLLIRHRSRRPGIRLPQFPREAIREILDYAQTLQTKAVEGHRERLRNLRDRAFLITLADTGLRVHEACEMRRGDIDWNEGHAVIVGKGDRQALVRFSERAMRCLKDYLSSRGRLDGASGRPLATLPLFARHDRGAGSKVLPISTTTGRAIVNQRAEEAIGPQAAEAVTPHSFRHFFVTSALRGSGGNLKLAQELARHKNISVTQRYAHLSDDELDRGYHEIFNRD